jgi:hypothetical protein
MPISVSSVPQLKEFESYMIIPLENRGIGTIQKLLQIRGNSLLSTVRVSAIDPGATLLVTYYDTTSGDISPIERNVVQTHSIMGGTGVDRKVVTRFHDKPVCEAIVSGGNIEFSVYVTVTADMALDPTEILPPYSGVRGTSHFDSITTQTDPLNIKTLITEVVPINTKRYLHTCYVSCRMEGVYKIFLNSDVPFEIFTLYDFLYLK